MDGLGFDIFCIQLADWRYVVRASPLDYCQNGIAEATIPLTKASHFFDSNQMIWMMWHLAIAEFDA